MTRVQLALNVSDIDESVAFYSALFGVEPHKRRPGYANFALVHPPMKLVLLESQERGSGVLGALNHLGVEETDPASVEIARNRLGERGLITLDEPDTVCCHARQDKVWAEDPDGAPWEFYAITDDLINQPDSPPGTVAGCCGGRDA